MREAVLLVSDAIYSALRNHFICPENGALSPHTSGGQILPETSLIVWSPLRYSYAYFLLMLQNRAMLDIIPESLIQQIASEAIMASGNLSAIRKASPYCVKLMDSYCVGCGLLIAARIKERLHECPVYFRYEQPQTRAS